MPPDGARVFRHMSESKGLPTEPRSRLVDSNPRLSSVPYTVGLLVYMAPANFLCGCQDLNSGPHAYLASTFIHWVVSPAHFVSCTSVWWTLGTTEHMVRVLYSSNDGIQKDEKSQRNREFVVRLHFLEVSEMLLYPWSLSNMAIQMWLKQRHHH